MATWDWVTISSFAAALGALVLAVAPVRRAARGLGALRDPGEPMYTQVGEAVRTETPLTVMLLYTDEEGGQRTVTRYRLLPHRTDDGTLVWLATVSRHWNIDRVGPR